MSYSYTLLHYTVSRNAFDFMSLKYCFRDLHFKLR